LIAEIIDIDNEVAILKRPHFTASLLDYPIFTASKPFLFMIREKGSEAIFTKYSMSKGLCLFHQKYHPGLSEW